MNMAIRRNPITLLYRQWLRRYAQRRMLRELGWKTAWQRSYKA